MAEHTELPWRWVPARNDYPRTYLVSGDGHFDDWDSDNAARRVLDIYESHGGGNMPNAADKDFILRACNSHDALVDVLRQALVYIESDETTHGRQFGTGNAIRTAIANAGDT